jgi:hypothetical protein
MKKSFLAKGCKFSLYALKLIGVGNNNNNNNNNNKVILIKIITNGNLTLTKRLIKKYTVRT